jgi:hypothetical protein
LLSKVISKFCKTDNSAKAIKKLSREFICESDENYKEFRNLLVTSCLEKIIRLKSGQ